MGSFVSHPSWMGDISDDIPVTALSIPGTHNSGCTGGLFGFAQTQDLDLGDQLKAGIRFLDIRLSRCEDDLLVYHDMVYMGKNYTDIQNICANFLGEYPSETILMSIQEESRLDSGLGRFAPSEILGKLSRGVAMNSDRNTRSFEDILKAKTWDYTANSSLFHNFTASHPDDHSRATTHEFTSETTLGEVRGKIILLRRFEGSEDAGLDLTYWPENQTFRSASPPIHDVHDRHQLLREEDKYELVIAHLEEARRGDPKDLYITFSSAVDLTARGYAKTINPRLNDYLVRSLRGRVGVIAMDYFEEPPELVSNIINMNHG
ncbi:MAG: phosphatidylinositol-specific phospholipase C [Pseudonocardiaceae bacterium]